MSTNAIWTTFCDATLDDTKYPRSAMCPDWASQEESAGDARKAAKAKGWALGVSGLPDLCPMCRPYGWCPRCDARGTEHCSTVSGRDHRERRR